MTEPWTPAPLPPAPCPYCAGPVELREDSKWLYRGRNCGPVWACTWCGAYVGCHPGTTDPLGSVADKQTRSARMRAHTAFDRLWRTASKRDGVQKWKARRVAYTWLARTLGINGDHCHISMMDVVMCERVVEVCASTKREGEAA